MEISAMQVRTLGKRTADIRDHLLRQIEIGNFSRGAALPSERELAEQLDASYMTIRKAIGQLVQERYPGTGSAGRHLRFFADSGRQGPAPAGHHRPGVDRAGKLRLHHVRERSRRTG